MYRCVPLCHHQSTRFKSAALIRHYARPLNNCLNFKLLARNYLYISNKEDTTEVESSLTLFCSDVTRMGSQSDSVGIQVIRLGFEPKTPTLKVLCSTD